MKIKTSELTGAALDWAVGVSMGQTMRQHKNLDIPAWFDADNKLIYLPASAFSPSTKWEHGAPLIDQFQIYLSPPHIVFATKIVDGKRVSADKVYDGWTATISARVAMKPSPIPGLTGLGGNYSGEGYTAMFAICRAVVACKLGDEVDVPDELAQSCAT